MKKIGLYSPFMSDNIGGGERYLLTVADCLLSDCQVDLVLQHSAAQTQEEKNVLKKSYIQAFKLNLDKLNLVNGPFGGAGSLWKRWQFTKQYDVFYYMTDGSFFIPGAKRNVVHFMIPFKEPRGGKFNKLKLKLWQIKVANAFFTKGIIEKNWGIRFDYVHWGAVNKEDFKPQAKKNLILNVGRFFTPTGGKHCKRQDVLVDVFKKMCDQGLKNWQLVLIGAIDKGEDNAAYARQIEESAKEYPITIEHGIPFEKIQKYYGQAKIYWHATGYGLNEEEHPESMEHLGLTTVEAMAAGLVPVVIHKAGQKEIVTEGENGLFWETKGELITKTLQVINDKALWLRLSHHARQRADDFSKEYFCKMTRQICGL